MMKRYNILLILFVIICGSQISCSAGDLSSKLNLKDPKAVSEGANRGSIHSSNSDSVIDAAPMINSMMGLGNMMQGVSSNPYSAQEQQKQQMEYVKQQMETIENE